MEEYNLEKLKERMFIYKDDLESLLHNTEYDYVNNPMYKRFIDEEKINKYKKNLVNKAFLNIKR